MTPWLGNHRPCTHIYVAEGCVYCPRDRVLFVEPVAWLSVCGLQATGTLCAVAFQTLAMRAVAVLPNGSVDAYIWLRPGLLPACEESIPPGGKANRLIKTMEETK